MEKILLRKVCVKAFFKVLIFLCHYLQLTIFDSCVLLAKLSLGFVYPVFSFTKPNFCPGTAGDYFAVTPLSVCPDTCLGLSPCPPASKNPSQAHEPQKVL